MPQEERYPHKKAQEMLDSGLSVKEVAERLNVSRQAIYNLKRKTQTLKSESYIPGNKHSSIDEKRVTLRGKHYSISETLKAFPLLEIFRNLPEEQVNDLCYRILEWAIKAPILEKENRIHGNI